MGGQALKGNGADHAMQVGSSQSYRRDGCAPCCRQSKVDACSGWNGTCTVVVVSFYLLRLPLFAACCRRDGVDRLFPSSKLSVRQRRRTTNLVSHFTAEALHYQEMKLSKWGEPWIISGLWYKISFSIVCSKQRAANSYLFCKRKISEQQFTLSWMFNSRFGWRVI